jgi:hypothetical protein
MEISQGNSLCIATFITNKQKYHVFIFSFSFYKIREKEGRTGSAKGVGVSTSERREVMGKRDRRVNMVQKLCTHVCKCKNDTC